MRKNVAVIFGSKSVEHEISIITANQILNAIDRNKYNVIPVYINKDGDWYTGSVLEKIENFKNLNLIEKKAKKINQFKKKNSKLLLKTNFKTYEIDLCILATHGTYGEDGSLQGFCEMFDIPYTGSGILSSAIAMDKVLTKLILKENNIPVVDFKYITKQDWDSSYDKFIETCEKELGYPMYIKPARLGSSIGISKVYSKEEFITSAEVAFSFDNKILVERSIENAKELNCAVLGYKQPIVSEIEEIIKQKEFFDFKEKYINKGKKFSNHKIPAELDENIKQEIIKLAVKTFKSLDCYGNIRIDFLYKDKIYVNEVNTIPGAMAFYLWQASGITFTHLIDNLINIAEKVYKDKKKKIYSIDTNILSIKVTK
ncbi:D-alanine--D-alanine ligase family protein [Thermosipho atlanticus]|uniref:D-alanine--D-alanine ligase n=1 Tax=Thermosipho atlanticus DSM 15807 TaxID=1123380 RepID=A0A1M5T8P7_9BACT|nr:D-alanine--D-alanine ligase family protein [Thermosipho atlanticus]SHH47147.1 D-alanine-D-alanine ligase [Thermosipho atlanticus DSM 15807]